MRGEILLGFCRESRRLAGKRLSGARVTSMNDFSEEAEPRRRDAGAPGGIFRLLI